MSKSVVISFEVRCGECGTVELWGLERAIRAMTAAGKLSPQAEFDPNLFAELFPIHVVAVICPNCQKIGKLRAVRAKAGDWDWEDAVRCEDCGREIPEQRLQAVPGATRCVACQREFEK